MIKTHKSKTKKNNLRQRVNQSKYFTITVMKYIIYAHAQLHQIKASQKRNPHDTHSNPFLTYSSKKNPHFLWFLFLYHFQLLKSIQNHIKCNALSWITLHRLILSSPCVLRFRVWRLPRAMSYIFFFIHDLNNSSNITKHSDTQSKIYSKHKDKVHET